MEAFPKTAAFLKGQAGYFEEVEGALTLAFDVYQETGLPDCPKTFLEALLDEDDARDMRQCSLDQMDFDEHDTYAAIMQFLKDAQAAAQIRLTDLPDEMLASAQERDARPRALD